MPQSKEFQDYLITPKSTESPRNCVSITITRISIFFLKIKVTRFCKRWTLDDDPSSKRSLSIILFIMYWYHCFLFNLQIDLHIIPTCNLQFVTANHQWDPTWQSCCFTGRIRSRNVSLKIVVHWKCPKMLFENCFILDMPPNTFFIENCCTLKMPPSPFLNIVFHCRCLKMLYWKLI